MKKVVFEGKTEKGKHILIRYPTHKDTKVMCEYINTLSKEQTFIRYQGEGISLESLLGFIPRSSAASSLIQ